MATRIKLRRDSNADWTAANPILSEGEIGIVTDAASDDAKVKIGDGTTAWNDLSYFDPGNSGAAWGSITGTLSGQSDLQAVLDLKATTAALTSGLATKEDAFSKNSAFNKNFGSASGTVTQGNDYRLYQNLRGFQVVNFSATTFTASTDTFTTSGFQVRTPAGGIYSVGITSTVVPSGSMLLVSSTTPAYTPLDRTETGSVTGYPFVASVTGFNYERSGVVILGINWVDIWITDRNSLDPNYWINKTTKTTVDTAVTNISTIRANRWNNLGATTAALGSFITKLREKTVGANNLLNLICWGDSIFGRLYQAEMSEASDNEYSPPGMYRQNIAREILDNFQMTSSNLKYYPLYDMSGFVSQEVPIQTTFPSDSAFASFSGTWEGFANNDFHFYKKTSTSTSYVDIELEAGFSRANLIAQRSAGSSSNIDVTVSVNGGAFDTLAAASITGSSSFSLVRANADYNTGQWDRQYRQEFTGLNTANTYTFRFTHNGTGSFWVWGMEAWDTPSLRVINAGRGGSTMSSLKNFLYDDIINTNRNPDALIFELTMLNDSYVGGGTPSEAQELSTMNNLDEVLRKIAEVNIPTICIIPHHSTTEPGHYEKYIQFARSYCAKYGIPCIDMYAKWKELAIGSSGVSDGTHLNDTGVTAYYEEIEKILSADEPASATVKSTAITQAGLLASVGTITFDTPYLTAPKVTITPVKDGGVTPDVYLDGNPTTTGFTVAGTGKFNWEAKL